MEAVKDVGRLHVKGSYHVSAEKEAQQKKSPAGGGIGFEHLDDDSQNNKDEPT